MILGGLVMISIGLFIIIGRCRKYCRKSQDRNVGRR